MDALRRIGRAVEDAITIMMMHQTISDSVQLVSPLTGIQYISFYRPFTRKLSFEKLQFKI